MMMPISRRWLVVGVAVLMVLSLSTALALAQGSGYVLGWWTVDGGGGESTGGDFRLAGTAGQPDAGAMSGGNFRLGGGHWGGGASTAAGGEHDVYLPAVIK